MTDDEGLDLTDDQLLTRVAAIGATVVHRGPVERNDLATWRRELRRQARAHGLRISVRQVYDERTLVVSNPDHQVTDEQLRAAVRAMTSVFEELAAPLKPPTSPRPHLRVVRDD